MTIELTILSCSAAGIQMVELCAFSLVVNYVSARVVSIFVVCFFFKINSLVVLVVIVSVVFSYHLYSQDEKLFTEVHQTQQRVHWFFSNPILDVPRGTTTHRLHYENMLSLTYFLDGRKSLCINTIYV